MTERPWRRGPWAFDGCEHCNDHGGRFYEVVDADGDAVIGEFGGPYDKETLRLIAAAPDMAEALDHCEAVMSIVQPRSHTAEYLECLGKIRAALRKATEGDDDEG